MGSSNCHFCPGREEDTELRLQDTSFTSSPSIPQDFFTNLPKSTVVLVPGKESQRVNTKVTDFSSVSKKTYNLPDDFIIPPELCIQHEQGLRLNKRNMKLFADYFLEDEKEYRCFKDTPELKVWEKKGNDLFQDFLAIKSMYTLDGRFPLDLVIEVLSDVNNRTKWEKQILEAELLRKYNESFFTSRMLIHTPWIENRDFAEKVLTFQVDDSYYIYSSSIPDKFCPKRSGCTRGYNIFSVTRMQKVGNKIKVVNASQKDVQASFTGFITLGMMGEKTADSITEYYKGLVKRLRSMMNV